MTIPCVTTGTGYFKAGVHCEIIGGSERLIYVGAPGHEVPMTIPEFTLRFTDEKKNVTRREFYQYGRDFVFAK